MNRWYYAREKQKIGPVSLTRLQQLATSGELQPSAMVLQEGNPKWMPASAVPDIFRQAAAPSCPVATLAPRALPSSQPAPCAVALPQSLPMSKTMGSVPSSWLIASVALAAVVVIALAVCVYVDWRINHRPDEPVPVRAAPSLPPAQAPPLSRTESMPDYNRRLQQGAMESGGLNRPLTKEELEKVWKINDPLSAGPAKKPSSAGPDGKGLDLK